MSTDEATFEVEPEGVHVPALFGVIVFGMIAIAALVIVGVALSNQRFQDAKMEATQETGYPVLFETKMNAESLLDGYEAVENGRYRIPIERAMELESQGREQ